MITDLFVPLSPTGKDYSVECHCLSYIVMWQVVGVLFLSPTAHTHTHTHTHSTCTHCPDPQQWLSAVAVKETEVWEVRFHAVALALRSHPSHKPVWLLFE